MPIVNGLLLKNGKVISQSKIDLEAHKKRVQELQKPQPRTIARRKAREEALAKKRK